MPRESTALIRVYHVVLLVRLTNDVTVAAVLIVLRFPVENELAVSSWTSYIPAPFLTSSSVFSVHVTVAVCSPPVITTPVGAAGAVLVAAVVVVTVDDHAERLAAQSDARIL